MARCRTFVSRKHRFFVLPDAARSTRRQAPYQLLAKHNLGALIGADYYTTALREAVEICVEASRKAAPDEIPAQMKG